jgi:hypothetical protein
MVQPDHENTADGPKLQRLSPRPEQEETDPAGRIKASGQ